ncbi:MAG TPA: fused MFS/spermidine synthase [Syntrophales bacterium]|nr:fused MFS/spermidine synthase [Syntrophales bacterium]HPQ43577.1 fused MFS/spermidine synthase [Syntrophales bacterium]
MARTIHAFSVLFAITALGISSVITQITVIREFVTVFEGNEIVLGILFSLWFLLTGLGAWLGKFITSERIQMVLLQISLYHVAFLPIVHIILIRLLRNDLFIRGEIPGIWSLLIGASVLLLPYCILSGGLLTLACSVLNFGGFDNRSIGRVYFFDNIGDILGGAIFTFVLVHFCNNLTVLYLPFFLCLLGYLLLAPDGLGKKSVYHSLGLAGLIFLLYLAWFVDLDTISLQWLYPHQKIADHRESPYGRLVVTKDHDQVSFFENGEHLFSTPNTFANEEIVHYALPQLRKVDSVLLISGGMAGVVDEILKYDVGNLDYVELDPAIISTGTRHLGVRFPSQVHINLDDGRRFVKKTDTTYDAIIIDLPPPGSLQLNRFYTLEFFREARSVLLPGGVLCFGVPGAENYISEDQALFLSTLNNTLKRVFNNVLIIPGERNIFIVSDSPLSSDIASLIASRKIQTVYVNRHYLDGRVTPERLSFIKNSIMDSVPSNHDFRPTAFFYRMHVWLGMFQENYRIVLIAALFFFVMYFLRIGMIGKAIFSTGFTASSMEIVILLCYQIVYGSVYIGVGFIIASFMSGLAVGSFAANRVIATNRVIGKRSIIIVEVAIAIYLILFMTMLFWGRALLGNLSFALLTILIGALTGAEFPIAGKILFSTPWETAGSLYAADLLGASLGALVVSLFIIPAVGIYYTCSLLILCKVFITLGLWFSKRSSP